LGRRCVVGFGESRCAFGIALPGGIVLAAFGCRVFFVVALALGGFAGLAHFCPIGGGERFAVVAHAFKVFRRDGHPANGFGRSGSAGEQQNRDGSGS
jgi:hypothetical protein